MLSMDSIYDEARVPAYTLPDPLVLNDGSAVADARVWNEQRRPELLDQFARSVYGRTPADTVAIRFEQGMVDATALGGAATRIEVGLLFGQSGQSSIDLLLHLPNRRAQPAPLFLGLNFHGNHAIHPDPTITLSSQWMPGTESNGILANRATEASRGVEASRWPVEEIIARGYGLATVYYGDLDPDFDDGFHNGVHPLFSDADQPERTGAAWGAIGAWAWGLSRAMDYFEQDPSIDHTRVALIGHSRLGKAAVWAGAHDERFALVIANNSGCRWASRRRNAAARNTSSKPYWLPYSAREARCHRVRLAVLSGLRGSAPVACHRQLSALHVTK